MAEILAEQQTELLVNQSDYKIHDVAGWKVSYREKRPEEETTKNVLKRIRTKKDRYRLLVEPKASHRTMAEIRDSSDRVAQKRKRKPD